MMIKKKIILRVPKIFNNFHNSNLPAFDMIINQSINKKSFVSFYFYPYKCYRKYFIQEMCLGQSSHK